MRESWRWRGAIRGGGKQSEDEGSDQRRRGAIRGEWEQSEAEGSNER